MKSILSIKEVKQLSKNSDFIVRGIVSKLTRRKDRNDNPFWEMTISDSSGDLDGKVWTASIWWNTQGGEKFPIDPDNCGLRFEGSSVEIDGKIAEFREQIQYNFNAVFYLDQSDYPPHMFSRHSPVKPEFLEETFKNLIAEVKREDLRSFLEAVFFTHNLWEKFRVWPAAISLHHAYTGGLLEHSVSVALGAKGIANHYSDFAIPVDMDLVIAGALLHDIGKLEAYANAPVPSMTIRGNVIEHITLGVSMFMKFAELEKLNENLTLALGHIIASHHGRREFGSPVLPEAPEAMIVSTADDLDFRLAYWKLQIDALNPQSDVTDYLALIDRRLWRGIPQA
ncbi:MAG: HD domain-containing protein [Synergistaceae bacterium]|nr:HD domain-containing protein [Synergistaceae bacterium]